MDRMHDTENASDLDLLLAASRALQLNRPFGETARILFDYACQATGACSGYVALLSDDGHENEVLFLEAGGMPCTVDPELPMPIRGLRAQAYESGEPAWDNDFMNSAWVDFMPAGHARLRNVMFAPLNIDGVTVGIMGIANKPEGFHQDDARMAGALGDMAAVALRNARNLDRLERTVAELERALAEVKTLQGFLPICCYCRKIRVDDGYWRGIEQYLEDQLHTTLSHGLCPECFARFDELISDE